MPGHDNVDAGASIGPQRLYVVQNVDRLSRQAHKVRVGIFASPLAIVYVSTDGGDATTLIPQQRSFEAAQQRSGL
jgi:hypothetical protein